MHHSSLQSSAVSHSLCSISPLGLESCTPRRERGQPEWDSSGCLLPLLGPLPHSSLYLSFYHYELWLVNQWNFFFFFYLDLKVSNNFPFWFDTMDHSLWRCLWTGTNAFDTFCTLQDFVLLRFYPSWSPPISVENYQSDVASLIFHLCGLRCILHSVIFIFYFYNFLEYFNSKNI